MKITEIAFIGYPVTDVQRARKFYEGTLGLKATMEHEIGETPGVYWIEYDLPNATFAISNAWPPAAESGPTVAFEVEDLDGAVSELKQAGAKIIEESIESPVCRFALVADPDGNGITIHQRKPSA